MDLKVAKQEIDKYFETHTKGQILKHLYGNGVERLKKFNPILWKEAIKNQIELNDEDIYSIKECDELYKYFELFENWSGLIDEKIPWQNVDESMFPIQFLILENDGKTIVLSVMIGQGSSTTICSKEQFIKWMERCENVYTYDESKFISIDALNNIVLKTIEEYTILFEEDVNISKIY